MGRVAYTLFACWFMFFSSISLRFMFITLVPTVAAELGFSATQSGLLIGVYYIGYSLAVWVSGFIPGPRKAVIIGGAMMSLLGLAAVSRAPGFTGLLTLAPISSFGAGLYLPRGIALLSDISDDATRGRNISIHDTAATAGVTVGPLFVGAALSAFGWRDILVMGGAVVIVGIILFSGVAEVPPLTAREGARGIPGENTLKPDMSLILFAVVGGCLYIPLVGLLSVLPVLLVGKWGIAPAVAASFLGTTRLAGFMGPVVAGPLSDRLGRYRVLLWFFVLVFLSLLVLMASGFGTVFTLAIVALTFSTSGAAPVFLAVLTEAYGPGVKDRVVGLVSGSASLLGSSVAPAVFGFLIEYSPAYATFGAAALAILLGMGVLQRFSLLAPGLKSLARGS